MHIFPNLCSVCIVDSVTVKLRNRTKPSFLLIYLISTNLQPTLRISPPPYRPQSIYIPGYSLGCPRRKRMHRQQNFFFLISRARATATRVLHPEEKGSRRGTDALPPSNDDVKNEWKYMPHPLLYSFIACTGTSPYTVPHLIEQDRLVISCSHVRTSLTSGPNQVRDLRILQRCSCGFQSSGTPGRLEW